jgi:hypothetical protein
MTDCLGAAGPRGLSKLDASPLLKTCLVYAPTAQFCVNVSILSLVTRFHEVRKAAVTADPVDWINQDRLASLHENEIRRGGRTKPAVKLGKCAYHCGVKTPGRLVLLKDKIRICFLPRSAMDIIICQHISKSIVIVVSQSRYQSNPQRMKSLNRAFRNKTA